MSDLYVVSGHELRFEGESCRCAIGPNGFTAAPREGGKATPIGIFPLRECWFRADRVPALACALPTRIITPDDGWCDAADHPLYNRHVTLPFAASHERLWREEPVYDIVIPIGFNDDPVTPGKGSAIFFHLAHEDYRPTLGCVAISRADMLRILPRLTRQSRIFIGPGALQQPNAT